MKRVCKKIIHGEADTRVCVMQSCEIYRELIDNGIDVEMILYPGAGHSTKTA